MLDSRRVVKNRKIQPEAAFCPTKSLGLEWMNSNPRMQIAEKWTDIAHQPDGVELNLTMENGETWRWVFITPGDMPEIQTAPKETNADPTQPAAENAAQPVTTPQPDTTAEPGVSS